jgi:HEAT repeat protein
MFMRKAGSAAVLAVIGLFAAGSQQTEAWDIINQAVRSHGPDEASALGTLGAVDSPASQALIEATLKSGDGMAIASVATGLTSEQCAAHLADLGRAVEGPIMDVDKPRILGAIARAGNVEAARILSDVADRAGLPVAGVAFGVLGTMGAAAGPVLIGIVTGGHSAWSRETAAAVLRRLKVASALGAFRSALHDPDDKVRIEGALGLADSGSREGIPQLEAAAGSPDGEYRTTALVSLAALGVGHAYDDLKALITGPDEALRARTVWQMVGSGDVRLKGFAYRLGLDRQPIFRGMLAEKLLDPADPRDAAVLQDMIANGDEMSQLIAAQRLLGTKLTALAEATVGRGIESGNQVVRALAVKIASGFPALRPELARHLSSPDPEVKISALSMIADLHEKERFSEVAPYVASEDRAVSAAAARTIAALDPDAAERVFEEGLTSKTSYVRIHSAAMLLAIAARAQPKQNE